MGKQLRHNCGFCVAHSLRDAYGIIEALSHRGREAAGIAAIGEDVIDVVKWSGPLSAFDLEDLGKILDGSRYHTYMAHVRYATTGRKDQILKDAHPHVIGGEETNYGNHTVILGCDMAIVHNGQVDDAYLAGIDRHLLKSGCDTEALLHFYRTHFEFETVSIPGAFTLAIADRRRKEVIVMKDRTGIKPGVLGWKDGKFIVASEDSAIIKNGGKYREDLDLGSVYYLTPEGNYWKEAVAPPSPKHCFFEWNYLASPDSTIDKVSVRRVRELLGEALAQEHLTGSDAVTYVPRCPEIAAYAYSGATGIPLMNVFYKMRQERAFQGSTDDERRKSISENLYLFPKSIPALKGRNIDIVEDSVIRGNNASWMGHLLTQDAQAEGSILLSYTPPVGIIGADGIPRGCEFGVDMSPNDSFLARGRTIEEMGQAIGMPLSFISLEGMLEGFEHAGMPRDNLCTYCIGGCHPFKG